MKFRVRDQLLLPFMPEATISSSRAAEMLSMSPETIRRMVIAGELSGYKMRDLKNSPLRIDHESVMKYLDAMYERTGLKKRY